MAIIATPASAKSISRLVAAREDKGGQTMRELPGLEDRPGALGAALSPCSKPGFAKCTLRGYCGPPFEGENGFAMDLGSRQDCFITEPRIVVRIRTRIHQASLESAHTVAHDYG